MESLNFEFPYVGLSVREDGKATTPAKRMKNYEMLWRIKK
jgi:hypothetical protein